MKGYSWKNKSPEYKSFKEAEKKLKEVKKAKHDLIKDYKIKKLKLDRTILEHERKVEDAKARWHQVCHTRS